MSRYESWEDDEEERARRAPSMFRLDAFLRIVRKKHRIIIISTVAFTCVIVLLSLLLRDTYESTAVILPPRQEQSVSALLSGQTAGLSTLASGGAFGAVSLKNPNEVYTSLLESRTLTTNIVIQFNLRTYYHKATVQGAVKTLQRHVSIELGKDNLIRISVKSHEADLSSKIANAFVDQLHDMNTALALTDSAQRRLFFQDQLDQEKLLLTRAETDLQETQTRTGVLQPAGQADLVARSISALRAQITAREAELESLKTFDAPGNPDYMQLRAQIDSLHSQLSELENSNKAHIPGDIEVPTSRLPQSVLEYARKYREVQQHEQIYALLLKQYEAATMDEAKTAPVIEVVDHAIPADLPSGMPRWLIGLCAFIAALVLNLIWCACVCAFEILIAQGDQFQPHS